MLTSTVDEILAEIAAGRPDACLVYWDNGLSGYLFECNENNAVATIAARIVEFQEAGWNWDGRDLTKDGWLLFFRTQGTSAPPICQWSRRKA